MFLCVERVFDCFINYFCFFYVYFTCLFFIRIYLPLLVCIDLYVCLYVSLNIDLFGKSSCFFRVAMCTARDEESVFQSPDLTAKGLLSFCPFLRMCFEVCENSSFVHVVLLATFFVYSWRYHDDRVAYFWEPHGTGQLGFTGHVCIY